MRIKYATVAEASEAAKRLGFKSRSEYKKGYQQDPKLPSNPNNAYAKDWDDWYEFLGTDRPGENRYATLAEASEAAQRLGFKTFPEYQKEYKLDLKLPAAPNVYYAADWIDTYDFLGVKRPPEKYATLAEAYEASRRLGFKSSKEYLKGYQQDPRLPIRPDTFYSDEWVDWYDFFGRERNYATYAEASEAAKRLGFAKRAQYLKGFSKDPKLPYSPENAYAENWKDWHAFLGTQRNYATYAEASEAAKRLGLKTLKGYQVGYKKDLKLPYNPENVYAENWEDWHAFLGTQRNYATYAEASEAAQALGLKKSEEYFKGYRQDPRLPSAPNQTYTADWVDWHAFLGTDRRGEAFYPTYVEASEAAQRLGFTSSVEYHESCHRDPRLAVHPNVFYAQDWVDWFEFLGSARSGEKWYATYAEASAAAQALAIKSSKQYKNLYRNDVGLPSLPNEIYSDDWVDWFDFLGIARPPKKYATYAEASEVAQRLGFKSLVEYTKGYHQDPRLPVNPHVRYSEHWPGWPKFLGNENAFDPNLLTAYPRFWKAIQRFVYSGVNQNAKYTHLRGFLKDYVATQKLIDDPGVMLSRDIPFNDRVYEAFVHATGETQKKARHKICSNFFEWVLETYCSDEDDDGELAVLPGYRNPLRTVLKGLLDQLPSASPDFS
ncbi:VPA1269 family protein [Marinobacter sp. OP 3.4]|uniref:VPA1269 family protein n=1 Tax=Marinobacter sp. OP 3.4 TaxID=3076501 RepID=UPI002E1DF475